MRAALLHPFGIAVLAASLLLGGAMRFLPGLERWSAQAPWMLFWGLVGYTATVVTLLRARPEGPVPVTLGADLSESAIKGWLRAEATQSLGTLLPLGVAVISAGFLVLLAPTVGGGPWALIVLILSSAAAVGSFFWHYVFQYGERYAAITKELVAIIEEERARLEQAEVKVLREGLQAGFAAVNHPQGAQALKRLDEEYSQLQPIAENRRDTDPLSISYVPGLAGETYRRGLGVLADALELVRAAQGSNRERLAADIMQLEKEIEALKGDERQRTRTEIRRERLASHRQRLDMLDQLQVHVDQLLYQAERCEACLHRTRMDLAAIRAGGSETSLDSVIETLQETIKRAKEVQEELKRLGI